MDVGIGGVFLISEQPQRLANWYDQMFGLKFQEMNGSYAHTFGQAHLPRTWTTLSILPAQAPVPTMPRNGPGEHHGDQPVMLNMRISDLQAFLHLTRAEVEAQQVQPGVGSFVWIRDPDGNRVEVWEPATPSTQMV